jgi:small subunit ribosomal protein S16
MAATIRLRREGTKGQPSYLVVAADSRRARAGAYFERLGHYDPRAKKGGFVLDHPRYEYWVKQGATVSRTVAQLVARNPKPAEAVVPAAPAAAAAPKAPKA